MSSPCVRSFFNGVPTLLTLSLVLHPYYKLAYIEKKWGGAAEQQEAIAEGNPNAINWIQHARSVVEDAVSMVASIPQFRHSDEHVH